MHRNDSSATIASLPVRPNHVISWIFPSCNCKSVPIMSLLDILLCFLTNMLHMSLQVSFTMSLQARFSYVIASVLLICYCEYPLPCHYKFVFHMSLRGADRSDVAIFCQFSTWMWPTMQVGSRSATALVCNLLQVNLLQKHRWLTMHRNDSSATVLVLQPLAS